MLLVYRLSSCKPSRAGGLSASLRMSFIFLIFGLFVVDVIQTVFASPEPKKLTNEEVLKELGVEIKMKGKNDNLSNIFLIVLTLDNNIFGISK